MLFGRRLFHISFSLCAIFISLMATSQGGSRPDDPGQVVARVDGEPITVRQIQEELQRQNLTAPTAADGSVSKAQALDTLITNAAVDLEATAIDFSRDHSLLKSMRQGVLQSVVKKYAEEVVEPRLTVTVADVDQYWSEHPDQFTVSRAIVQSQQIMIMQDLKDPGYGSMPAEYDGWTAKQIADDLYRRLIEGEDFDTLATYYSQDPFTRKAGGRMGWVYYDSSKVSAYQDSLFAFPVGIPQPPFIDANAYFILRINGRHEAGDVIPLDDRMRREVADYIGKKRVEEWSDRFRDSLLAVGELKIIDSTLDIAIPDLPPDLPMAISNKIDTIFSDEFVSSSKLFTPADGSRTYQLEDKKRLLEDMHQWRVIWKAMKDVGFLDRPEFVEEQKRFLLNAGRLRVRSNSSDPRYRPTDDEIMRYYNERRAEFQQDSPLHVYQIVLDNPDTAWAVKRQLDNGADFVTMFRQHYHGDASLQEVIYDLGFITEGEMPPEFMAAASRLSVGEISDPVQTKWGYHIIKLVERKDAVPMRRVKEDIRGRLIAEHQRVTFRTWRNELVGRHTVEINHEVLARIPVLPPPSESSSSADTNSVQTP